MSKRAEQKALEFYPMKDYNKEPNYIHSCDSKMLDEVYREVFMLGYEQAEKDFALTWEDIKLLHRLFAEEENNFSKHDKYFYAEVLDRFNKSKEEKK